MSGPAQATEDQSASVFSFRARTTGLPPTDELLAAIRERVPDPSIFEQHPPVFMRAEASNRSLDAYFTRMAPSTLQNFAQDASDGVSFLNSHNMRSLGFGQTFAGRYLAGGHQRTDVDLYVMRGLRLNETSNDDFIAAVSGGSIKDVSVGFYRGTSGWYRCGICDARMQSFFGMAIPTCGHWPGDEYPVSEKDPEKGMRTAFAWVEDHRLAELSAVNDGATPNAGIKEVKARQMLASGELPRDAAERIAGRFGIEIPTISRSFAGAEIPQPAEEAEPMELTAEQLASIRLALTRAGQAPDADIPTAVGAVVDDLVRQGVEIARLTVENARLEPFEARCAELAPLADEGRQYRADLVASALAEGARAYGPEFSEETYRALLEAAPLETVKRMAADWKTAGDALFPGGRKTRDEAEPTPITTRKRRPAAAYS